MAHLLIIDSNSREPLAGVDVLAVDQEGRVRGPSRTMNDGAVNINEITVPIFVFLAKNGYEPCWVGPFTNEYRNEDIRLERAKDNLKSALFATNKIRLPRFPKDFLIEGSNNPHSPRWLISKTLLLKSFTTAQFFKTNSVDFKISSIGVLVLPYPSVPPSGRLMALSGPV